MRTTIDLPDSLFRKAKATAALRGLKLKELLTLFVENGLSSNEVEVFGRKEPIPVQIPPAGRHIPVMTNSEIFELLELEEDRIHGRLS